MASLFNDDESTDEDFDVNLHLVERLRINRGENSNFMEDRNFDNSKDIKQYCNMRRKLFAQEGQSSSSSSVEIQNDNPSSGLTSSDIYPNKKRQNGDKNAEQLANPKRTCLSDRFRRSPDWRELRKKTSNLEIQPEPPLFPDSYYMQDGKSPDLFPDKKIEEHTNSLADAEDSDFEIPIRSNRNIKLENGHSSKSSKHQSAPPSKVIQVPNLESKASTSFFKFLESGSEDESKPIMQNGALKGGRQDPDHNYFTKRLLGRKVNKKLLDSDESDDDNSVAVYRSRPLVYSSSDSEDLTQNTPKNKLKGASSNGSSNHSLSFGDGFDKITGHCSRQCKSFRSKFSKKIFSPLNSSRADSSDGCDRQYISSDFHRKNVTHRSCRTRRSPRLNMAAILSSNGITNGNNVNGPVRGRRTNGSERGGRRSGSPHHRNIRCQHKADETKCSRGRSISASRTQKEKPSYAARYPDVFDAEESDNEFFTANSYSDTETSTESLGGLTIDTTFPNHAGSISCTINCEERLFEDASTDDEISVVFSSGPYARNGEARRGSSRTLGRRHNRGTPHRQLQNAREVVSLSPDPVEQVRQVEEDERMARMLQAQFDAEVVEPDFGPLNRALMDLEDSDEDILDPQGESDSDGANPLNYTPYALTLPGSRRGFGLNRYSNRTASPAAIFLGRRVDTRNRRRYQISREHIDHNITRLLHLGIPDMSQFFDGDHYEALLSLDLDGDVIPRGLPKSEINRLPTRKYVHPNSAASSSSSEVTHKRTELNKECQVCLTDYENGDILRILPCFHEFHTPCIDPWLSINHTCPVCRVTVDLDA